MSKHFTLEKRTSFDEVICKQARFFSASNTADIVSKKVSAIGLSSLFNLQACSYFGELHIVSKDIENCQLSAP